MFRETFRPDVPDQAAPPEADSYEADISSRVRRYQQGPSRQQRRDQARAEYEQNGIRIRVARPVIRDDVLDAQRRLWHPSVQSGIARYVNKRRFGITVFDSKQQNVRAMPDHTEAGLGEKFSTACPGLMLPTGPIPVTGIELFGNEKTLPFIALTLAHEPLYSQQSIVGPIVAPELSLGDDHLPVHRPHVSLGRMERSHLSLLETHQKAREIIRILESSGTLPQALHFGPAEIKIEGPEAA